MLNWSHISAQQERYEDIRRIEEQEWLAEQVLEGPTKHIRLHHQALTWLGHRMIAWGQRLQEREGVATVTVCPAGCKR